MLKFFQRLIAENTSRERAGKWAAAAGEAVPAAAVPYQEGSRMQVSCYDAGEILSCDASNQRLATEFASQFDDLRTLLCDSKSDSASDSLRSLVRTCFEMM